MSSRRSLSTAVDVVAALEADDIDVVHVGIFDLDATFRERRLPRQQLIDFLAGHYSFVDVLHQWDTADSVHEGASRFVDERVQIDLATLRDYPFEPNAALMIADFAGPSLERSPRVLLERQVERAAAMGFAVKASLEFEFIVLEESAASLRDKGFEHLVPYPRDNRCWSGLTAATHADFVAQLEQLMGTLEIPLFSLGLELGPGCFEATLAADEPLRAADDAALFKLYTKAYCRRHGLTGSFMAQLSTDFPGLSGHVHLSLVDVDSGEPLFWDDAAEDHISATMRHFTGGMLSLMPETVVMVAHTVNAYRRMVPGNWAPRTPTWGIGNYTAAVRAMNRTPESARIEYRVPAADTNPYLAIAAALATGLWGIENQCEVPDPVAGNATEVVPEGIGPLPGDLGAAADRLHAGEISRKLFGDPFVDYFAASRRAEVAAFRKHVSAFERARYLEAM